MEQRFLFQRLPLPLRDGPAQRDQVEPAGQRAIGFGGSKAARVDPRPADLVENNLQNLRILSDDEHFRLAIKAVKLRFLTHKCPLLRLAGL